MSEKGIGKFANRKSWTCWLLIRRRDVFTFRKIKDECKLKDTLSRPAKIRLHAHEILKYHIVWFAVACDVISSSTAREARISKVD